VKESVSAPFSGDPKNQTAINFLTGRKREEKRITAWRAALRGKSPGNRIRETVSLSTPNFHGRSLRVVPNPTSFEDPTMGRGPGTISGGEVDSADRC
jgi:hypothetical protein